jgi:hypothetical protein
MNSPPNLPIESGSLTLNDLCSHFGYFKDKQLDECILQHLFVGASLRKIINGPVEFSPICGPFTFEWVTVPSEVFYKLLKTKRIYRSCSNKNVKWYSQTQVLTPE